MSIRATIDKDTRRAKVGMKHLPRAYEDKQESQQQKTTITDLIDKNGVKPEDFQAVCDEHPELIYAIGGGNTCSALANAADDVVTRYVRKKGKMVASTGGCLPGTRRIYANASKDYNIPDSLNNEDSRRAIVESRLPYQKNNGGGNGYVALEASGDYITVSIENTAYGKQKNDPMNHEMNEKVRNIQPGITITIDSIEDVQTRKLLGNTAGGIYGHIAVKRNDGNWGCDFNQHSINFARYGKYARICIPKDAEISEEYAQLLIEQAQKRQEQENNNQKTDAVKIATAKKARDGR